MKTNGDTYMNMKIHGNGEVNYEKQLPWMTLYKSQNDLLQIRLVTTIGYVEKIKKQIRPLWCCYI